MNRTWFIITCSVVAVLSKSDLDTGYYWREFRKEIPKDAFAASKCKSGKNIYVAKTVHVAAHTDDYYEYDYEYEDADLEPKVQTNCSDLIVVPGQIREGENTMEYEWGNTRQVAEKNFQILCTHQPANFEWFETNAKDIVNLQDRNLVSGGVEKGYTTYIGRDLRDAEIIGKVNCAHDNNKCLFYGTVADSYFHLLSDFEVLAYNSPKQ